VKKINIILIVSIILILLGGAIAVFCYKKSVNIDADIVGSFIGLMLFMLGIIFFVHYIETKK